MKRKRAGRAGGKADRNVDANYRNYSHRRVGGNLIRPSDPRREGGSSGRRLEILSCIYVFHRSAG